MDLHPRKARLRHERRQDSGTRRGDGGNPSGARLDRVGISKKNVESIRSISHEAPGGREGQTD